MKIYAVALSSSDLEQSIAFYTCLGFKFAEDAATFDHVEAEAIAGSPRLMIDTTSVISEIIGEQPRPGNHSSFAILTESVEELDRVCEDLKSKGFKLFKEPWDAFWGQRYAIVEDPDGYRVDLFCPLANK